MIYIVHGSDISKSRILIKNQQKKVASESRIEVGIKDISPQELTEKSRSSDLFGNPPFIVLDVTEAGRMDVKKYIDAIKKIPYETTLIILSDKKLPGSNAFIKSAKSIGAKVNTNENQPQSNIFNFVDSLFYKNRSRTYTELTKLLDDQVSPYEIFSMMLYNLRIIASAKFKSPSFFKKSPFVRNKATSQSQLFSEERIIKLFNELLDIDRGSKLSEYSPEMMVVISTEKILN